MTAVDECRGSSHARLQGSRRPTWHDAGGWTLLLALGAGYLAAVTTVPTPWRDTAATLLLLVVQFVSGLWLLRAASRLGSAAGAPWRYAGASAVASSCIFAVWLGYDLLGTPVPVPSVADVPFFLAVALMVPAVLAFPQQSRVGGAGTRLLLDGLVVASSLLVVAWHVVVEPSIAAASGWAQKAVLVAYPLSDVVVVTVACSSARPCGRAVGAVSCSWPPACCCWPRATCRSPTSASTAAGTQGTRRRSAGSSATR